MIKTFSRNETGTSNKSIKVVYNKEVLSQSRVNKYFNIRYMFGKELLLKYISLCIYKVTVHVYISIV